MNTLSISLSELGRQEPALAASEEAVEIYRELATRLPEAFRPMLASSLRILGQMLRGHGRHAEAQMAEEEAERLDQERPPI